MLWYQKRYLNFAGRENESAKDIKNSILYVLGTFDSDSDEIDRRDSRPMSQLKADLTILGAFCLIWSDFVKSLIKKQSCWLFV